MLISVIMPAYNAEETIFKTTKDILNQTYKDFELIIVNDGSTDHTSEMCERIKEYDNRVILINQENMGLSSARNVGVQNAKGKYITFVDSDDRLEKEYLQFMIEAVEKTGADFVMAGVDRVKENFDVLNKNKKNHIELVNQERALSEIGINNNYSASACCKLSLRNHYIKNPFIDKCYYEDLRNTHKIIMESKTIALVHPILYHYVMRRGSITGKRKTSLKQCLDYYVAIKQFNNEILTKYPNIKDSIYVLNAKDYMSLYLCIKRCEKKDNQLIKIEEVSLKWFKSNWKVAFMNKNASMSVRLRILLFAISPQLYMLCYNSFAGIKGKKFK